EGCPAIRRLRRRQRQPPTRGCHGREEGFALAPPRLSAKAEQVAVRRAEERLNRGWRRKRTFVQADQEHFVERHAGNRLQRPQDGARAELSHRPRGAAQSLLQGGEQLLAARDSLEAPGRGETGQRLDYQLVVAAFLLGP